MQWVQSEAVLSIEGLNGCSPRGFMTFRVSGEFQAKGSGKLLGPKQTMA